MVFSNWLWLEDHEQHQDAKASLHGSTHVTLQGAKYTNKSWRKLPYTHY